MSGLERSSFSRRPVKRDLGWNRSLGDILLEETGCPNERVPPHLECEPRDEACQMAAFAELSSPPSILL
jgi:hypothetical protein